MSDENMADDINKAISAGGYAIVPEKAVDGAGRSAIYVYYTENPQTGYSAWKISGGLNGGFFKNAFTKAKFWLGMALGYFNSLPRIVQIALKGIIKSIGVFLTSMYRMYDLLTTCKNLSFAIAVSVSLLLFEIATAAFLLLTGVGAIVAIALNATLMLAENKIINYLKENPACKGTN